VEVEVGWVASRLRFLSLVAYRISLGRKGYMKQVPGPHECARYFNHSIMHCGGTFVLAQQYPILKPNQIHVPWDLAVASSQYDNLLQQQNLRSASLIKPPPQTIVLQRTRAGVQRHLEMPHTGCIHQYCPRRPRLACEIILLCAFLCAF